jgi:hypothetical protein
MAQILLDFLPIQRIFAFLPHSVSRIFLALGLALRYIPRLGDMLLLLNVLNALYLLMRGQCFRKEE